MVDYYTIEQEKTSKDFCKDVTLILESKFTDEYLLKNEELDESSQSIASTETDYNLPELEESDILVLADFIISWCSRKCECLIKLFCDKLPILIQVYVQYTPSVLTSIWNQMLKLDETSQSQEIINTRSQLLKRFQLVAFAAIKCFIQNFTLFQVKKLRNLELVEEEQRFLKVEPGVHTLLLRNVYTFCQKGKGLDMIASFFRDSDTFARIPIIMAKEVCTLLLCVRTYILKYYVIECVTCVRPLVYKYLRQLSDNMIRDNKHNVAQIISSVSDPLEKGPSFDLDVLSLALKYICSSVLVLKLEGLTSLNQQLFLFLEWKAKGFLAENEHMLAKQYTNWIVENEIVERVLGRSGQGSFHPEVLKMSFGLLQFLATNFSLTTENVDALWEDTKDKHCSRHVFSNLSELSKYLEEDLVEYLLDKLTQLPVEEHSIGSINLCYCLTRAHWTCIQRGEGGTELGGEAQRHLDGACGKYEDNMYNSSTSSLVSTEAQAEDVNNEIDIEGVAMETGMDEQIAVVNFSTEQNTPPLTEELPPLIPLPQSKFGPQHLDDKADPMERQSSDTTQSYSLEAEANPASWDHEDSTEYSTIFSKVLQEGSPAIESVSKPAKCLIQHLTTQGNSILWELVQDANIAKLPAELRDVAQRYLADLIRQIRFSEVIQHFIRASLLNLSQDKSVIFSLNLLLSLLSSPPSGFSGGYCAFSWAQSELNMMATFFEDWKRFISKVEEGKQIDSIYSIPKQLDARLDFLSTLASQSFPAKAFTLTRECVDEIWKSLVLNSNLPLMLRNKGFSWFDLQVNYMPQKVIVYLIQNKISDLEPSTIPLAGFSLLRRLFQYSSLPLSSSVNPCLEQVWKIAMHHIDNQISLSAIQFLNASYFSRVDCSLSYEEQFIRRSIKFLAEGLRVLDTNRISTNALQPSSSDAGEKQDSDKTAALVLIRRTLELMLSHLSLFQERFSFHLRIWRLQANPLQRHCEEKFPGLSDRIGLYPPVAYVKGDTIKLHVVYNGYPESYKTILEVSSGSLLAELRAEVVYCLIHAGKVKTSSCSISDQPFPPLKISSEGQQLHHDSDSKTLKELEMKENSILQITHTSVPSSISDASISPSLLPPPNRKAIPHNLLVELEAIPLLLRVATVVYDPGEVLSTKVWRLLALLPTYPEEVRKAKRALAGGASEWECFLGLQPSEQDLFEQLYSLQAIQNLLTSQDGSLSLSTRRAGLTISVARLSTHMEFCLVGHNLSEASSQFSSCESVDKENMCPPSAEGGVEGWNCWYQAVLCYWMEILCLLCLHRVLEEASSGSDVEDLIVDLSQESVMQVVGAQTRNVSTPQYELQMPKTVLQMITEIKIDFLSLLSRALELGCLANSDCATIICHRAWRLLVCWCQVSPDALMELLTRKDFSGLAEKLLLHCQLSSVRKLARRSLKELYSESKDPSCSLTLLETLLHCSIDNTTLLNLSHEPPKDRRGILYENPSHPLDQSEQLLKQSGDCFQCVSDLIQWVYTNMRRNNNWKDNACYLHSCYERLITRAPYEVIDLICHKHYNRDTMDAPDIFLKGLLQIMTVLSKLSSDYTTSEHAKELVDCLLANLYPFKTYNPSDTDQSPLPTYCNMETRMHAVDLLEAMVLQNPKLFSLIAVAIKQNHPVVSGTPWEYRPKDDLRDNPNGYCGISNLGATCYMASTLQQLYMIPPLRNAILAQNARDVTSRHSSMFKELQKLFLHLGLSKRATYHPERFCREYIFDQQQLNPLEQRDMNEFFTDLLSKLEDISPLLKKTVKGLFGGVIANVVMSNECSHVSRNCEDFYSVRAKVADMPDLQASLQELTQTDVLDGDNKYTCSQCGVSVRAEKRACFAQLPSILCINTMRYTFNVATMVNEKVNTHFPFPLELDMDSFIESSNVTSDAPSPPPYHEMDLDAFNLHCTKYVLVGVVVHTGTSEGGHYYAILQERDQTSLPMSKWFMFNDQQVTEFDPDNIGQECYGGDIPNAGLDQHTRRIFPGLLERSNSAYMLFYQRKDFRSYETITPSNPLEAARPVLLENNKFLREVYTFVPHYLQALWKMCKHCKADKSGMLFNAVKVATQLLLTTIIHAKEKPNIRKCFEWLSSQYKEHLDLSLSFLDYLCQPQEHNWVVEMFYLCPIKTTREQFASLLITVLKTIRMHNSYTFYLDFPKVISEGDSYNVTISESTCSNSVSVAVLVKNVVDLMCIPDLMPGSNDFSPYFEFLRNFALLGQEECKLLTVYQVVNKIDMFYARGSRHGQAPTLAFEEGILSLVYDDHNNHPDSLAYLLNALLNYLLHDKLFSKEDLYSFICKPGYPLLTQLACSQAERLMTVQAYATIWQHNPTLISPMLDALFSALSKESRQKCANIYLVLNIMVSNFQDRSVILNSYLENIRKVFSLPALPYTIDFLSMIMLVYQPIYDWIKKQMGEWLSAWLIESEDVNVRKKTVILVCHLVPCTVFHEYANSRRQDQSEIVSRISEKGRDFLFEAVESMLQMLPIAAEMTSRCDIHDGIVQYFQLLEKCSVGDNECRLFAKYFNEFWNLYHPRIATANVDCHEDKNAMISYWLHVCKRYPPNIQCLLEHPTASRDISVIYILASTEKTEVVKYNNIFLDNYYTLLRLTCDKCPIFARELSSQHNIHWAIEHILPYYNLTQNAVDELYKMLNIFAKLPSSGSFRRKIITKGLQIVPPNNITTLRRVLKYLIRCEEDAMKAFTSGGLVKLSDAYMSLISKLNDSTASHHMPSLTSDLTDILSIVELILKFVCEYKIKGTCPKDQLNHWKESRNIFIQTIAQSLNSYVHPCHRLLVIQILELTVKLYPQDVVSLLIPHFSSHHNNFHRQSKLSYTVGPYFPRRKPNQDAPKASTDTRQFQQFNMFINDTTILAEFGEDAIYDNALIEFYSPYHELVRSICEIELTHKSETRDMIRLVVLMALEGLRLRLDIMPNFILHIKVHTKQSDTRIIDAFYENSHFVELIRTMLFTDNSVLLTESMFKFCLNCYPKIRKMIANEEWSTFFSKANGDFSQMDSDPNSHMANMKTLVIYLKTNSFETFPSQLSDTLSQYCSKYLNCGEIESLDPESPDETEVTEATDLEKLSQTPERQGGEGRERKRHSTPQIREITSPKRSKVEELSDPTQSSRDKSETDVTVTPTHSSEMPLAISSPAIDMLKLLRELLND